MYRKYCKCSIYQITIWTFIKKVSHQKGVYLIIIKHIWVLLSYCNDVNCYKLYVICGIYVAFTDIQSKFDCTCQQVYPTFFTLINKSLHKMHRSWFLALIRGLEVKSLSIVRVLELFLHFTSTSSDTRVHIMGQGGQLGVIRVDFVVCTGHSAANLEKRVILI